MHYKRMPKDAGEETPLVIICSVAAMGDVFAELEEVVRSPHNQGKFSLQEELVLQTCKSRATKDFKLGLCASAATVWIATARLTQAMRFNLSVGSATLFGMWSFDRSLSACLEQIMAIEGSRIQRELANIIVTKHEDDASKMKLVSKHFYPERVFNDQDLDKPSFRWRLRNGYTDSTAAKAAEVTQSEGSNVQQPNESAVSSVEVGVGIAIVDPLDCILGLPETITEMSTFNSPEMHPRQIRAKNKRSRRRRHRQSETD